ncbi:hypothetical protein Tco_0517708 [Tanacetum coccineum]
MKKKHQVQSNEELARRLQAEEEEEVRITQEKAAKEEAEKQERQNVPEQEREELWVELLRKRNRMLAEQKAEAKRKRPMTQAQQRKYMCTYLKNMAGWKPSQLKAFGDADIVKMFNNEVNKINNFIDFRQELIKESTAVEEKKHETSKKAGEELQQESSSKRQKVDEDNDKEKAELRQKMMIVPEEGIKIAALNVKYPIIDCEILPSFDRQDLKDLWNLVKNRFSSTQPTEDIDRMLYTELKRIFEPYPKDEV